MKKTWMTFALAVCFCTCFFQPVSAGFGTGIGVTFPMGGSSGSSSTRPESYAAFSADQLIQELTVIERSGRLLLEFKITNDSDTPCVISHKDGQCYDFALLDKNGTPLYQWSEGMAFTQALTETVYPPHESVIYTAEIERLKYKAIKEDAVVVTAFLTDTPYRLSTHVPVSVKSGSSPAILHGAIIIGNGRWYDD